MTFSPGEHDFLVSEDNKRIIEGARIDDKSTDNILYSLRKKKSFLYAKTREIT